MLCHRDPLMLVVSINQPSSQALLEVTDGFDLCPSYLCGHRGAVADDHPEVTVRSSRIEYR
jgi:hypothetical protein